MFLRPICPRLSTKERNGGINPFGLLRSSLSSVAAEVTVSVTECELPGTVGPQLLCLRGIAVHRIYPQHCFRFLDRLDIEIDRNRLAIAAHQHAFEHLVTAGVNLLVRHVGRDENKIAGIGFRGELQMLAPTHPRLSLDDVDDAFEMTMMMRTGLGIRLYRHGAGPQFLRANAGEVDCSLSIHPGSRGHIRIKLIAWNHANAIVLPAFSVVMMGMIGNGMIVRACHLLLSRSFRDKR